MAGVVNAELRRAGRVVDVSGNPVAGALVTIVRASVPMPEIAIVADSEGRFSLFLPAGRFTIRAHTATRGWGETEASGSPATDVILITIS